MTASAASGDVGSRYASAYAAAVEREHRDLQAQYARYLSAPVENLEGLWLLQSHHLKILGCVERGQPEEGVLHMRAHLRSMQAMVIAALRSQGAQSAARSQHAPSSRSL